MRDVLNTYVAASRERANAADGPFSAACYPATYHRADRRVKPGRPRDARVRRKNSPAFDPELQVAAWADGEVGVGYASGCGGIP